MAVKIVVGFVLKMAVYWPWLARDLFFCQSLEQSALKRYDWSTLDLVPRNTFFVKL